MVNVTTIISNLAGDQMFLTRRTPIKGNKPLPTPSRASTGGAGEAIIFILAGLGAIGGIGYVFTIL